MSLKLSSRMFVKTPIAQGDRGKVTPRSFQNYSVTVQDGGYFEASVKNSFPDLETRVRFLNSFYTCLSYGQLPQKTKKLLAYGEGTPGKHPGKKSLKGSYLKQK